MPEEISKLMSDFLNEIVYVLSDKIKKQSMIVKMPRLLCDTIWSITSSGVKDHESIVDACIGAFNDTMSREQKGNATYGYCKGFTREKLVNWMNRFVHFIEESVGGSFSRVRTVRDDVILPVFKGAVVRLNVEYWKKKGEEPEESDEEEEPEQ